MQMEFDDISCVGVTVFVSYRAIIPEHRQIRPIEDIRSGLMQTGSVKYIVYIEQAQIDRKVYRNGAVLLESAQRISA